MAKENVFGTPTGRRIPAHNVDPLEVPHAGNAGTGVSKGAKLAIGKEEMNNRQPIENENVTDPGMD